MRPFKKSARRKQQSRKSSNRFSALEKLENRALMTVNRIALDIAPVDHVAAEVSQFAETADSQQRVQRIVNGQQTSDYESVGIVNNQCTGTVIAPNAVLTAAHCIPQNPAEGGQTFEVGGRTYEAERVVVHPDYNSNLDIDLAVMILKQNVVGVEPTAINRTTPEVGQVLTLVGFGATGTPQAGHDGSFGVKNVGQTPIDEVTETHVNWNFDNANEANTAPGDSGGPAFLDVNGELVVAGVTSGGNQENAGLGDFSFDVRVDTFADWIDGVISGQPNTPVTNPGDAIDDPVDEVDDGFDDDQPIDDGGDEGIDDEFDGGDFDDGNFGDQEEAVELALDELANYDTNGDDAISRQELVNELLDFGYTRPEARDEASYIIAEYDSNGDRVLDFGELVVSYGGEPSDGVGDVDDGFVDDEITDDLDPVEDELTDEDPLEEDPIGEDPIDELDDFDHELLYGDIDADGIVEFDDFLVFSSNFGNVGELFFYDGDFNGDGAVGFDDFLGLSDNFGKSIDDWDFDARRQNEASTDEVFAELC